MKAPFINQTRAMNGNEKCAQVKSESVLLVYKVPAHFTLDSEKKLMQRDCEREDMQTINQIFACEHPCMQQQCAELGDVSGNISGPAQQMKLFALRFM
jgi:hypothetical protein